jgi:hypothetical protein
MKKELRLPGKTGALTGETFTRLSLLNEKKHDTETRPYRKHRHAVICRRRPASGGKEG